MSEKTKTPREMALDSANEIFLMDGVSMDVADNNDKAVITYGEKCYLAGLEAGAKMGYEAGFEVGFSDNKAMSFDEWWASLEKKDDIRNTVGNWASYWRSFCGVRYMLND